MLDLLEYTLQVRPDLVKLTGKESEHLFISNGTGPNLHNAMTKLMKKLRETNPNVDSLQ